MNQNKKIETKIRKFKEDLREQKKGVRKQLEVMRYSEKRIYSSYEKHFNLLDGYASALENIENMVEEILK